MDVVKIAAMVPLGMDRCASFKSPDLLEPAIIPVKSKILVRKPSSFRMFHLSFESTNL